MTDRQGLPVDTVIHGDSLEVLKGFPENSVDAIICDPPYGLGEIKDIAGLLQAWIQGEDGKAQNSKKGFMGKDWDVVPSPLIWKECYRVLRPGGYLLAFAGTRTWDMMSIAIRLAGFEERDTLNHTYGSQHLAWCYGSGFPKSTAIDKAIDKYLGKEREVIGVRSTYRPNSGALNPKEGFQDRSSGLETVPATPEAAQWSGWGNNLKPAWEPVLMFRKPIEGTLAENVLKHGVGGLNIAATRVGLNGVEHHKTAGSGTLGGHGIYGTANEPLNSKQVERAEQGLNPRYDPQGRFPSNLLLSHSLFCLPIGEQRVKGEGHRAGQLIAATKPDTYGFTSPHVNERYQDADGMETVAAYQCHESCPIRELDLQSGNRKGAVSNSNHASSGFMDKASGTAITPGYNDQGTASRYFTNFSPDADLTPFLYCAKASRAERNKGCEGLPDIQGFDKNTSKHIAHINHETGNTTYNEYHPSKMQNGHPTVKPQALMRWLIRLVGVPNGIILDPFCGSGSTLVACIAENMHFIGIEQSDTPEEPYVSIARSRIQDALQQREGARQKQQGAMKDEEEREYECDDSCPIKILGEQGGVSKSKAGNRGRPWSSKGSHEGWQRPSHESYHDGYSGVEDEGTAARYFTQFPPDSLFSSLPFEEPHEIQEQAEHTCHDV